MSRKRKWILVDSDNLFSRCFYAINCPRWDRKPNEELVKENIYECFLAFMESIMLIRRRFDTDRFAFCFDKAPLLRKKHCPKYKRPSKEPDPVDVMLKKEKHSQCSKLRRKVLKKIGYRNVFFQTGYEADDIIASVVRTNRSVGNMGDEFYIVSTDKDLLQLLKYDNTQIWNPSTREIITLDDFIKEWGIRPEKLPWMKAIAGDPSDRIPGLHGIGPIIAKRYIRGELREESKSYQRIRNEMSIVRKNLRLTRLPYKGVKDFELRTDRITRKSYRKVIELLESRKLF